MKIQLINDFCPAALLSLDQEHDSDNAKTKFYFSWYKLIRKGSVLQVCSCRFLFLKWRTAKLRSSSWPFFFGRRASIVSNVSFRDEIFEFKRLAFLILPLRGYYIRAEQIRSCSRKHPTGPVHHARLVTSGSVPLGYKFLQMARCFFSSLEHNVTETGSERLC